MSAFPLNRRRRVWLVLTCAVIGTLLAVSLSLSEVYQLSVQYPDGEPQVVLRWLVLSVVDVAGGIASLVLLWRLSGRYSLATGLVIIGVTAVSAFAVPASVYAIVEIAARKRWRPLALAFAVYVGAAALGMIIRPTVEASAPLAALIAAGILVFAIPVLIGFNVHSRREVSVLREREAESRVESAVLMERTRIAREIHDSLAHQLSLIALHAGVLESRSDLSPTRVKNEATIVGNAARAAADDVQSILTILRNEPTTRTPPEVKDIPELLAGLAQAGTLATVAGLAELTTIALPTSHSQQVFRIVQEATTNAHKHGVPGSLEISFVVDEGVLTIVSENAVRDAQSAGGGVGLVGMEERVSLLGGTLAVMDADGRFRLEVRIPCTQ